MLKLEDHRFSFTQIISEIGVHYTLEKSPKDKALASSITFSPQNTKYQLCTQCSSV